MLEANYKVYPTSLPALISGGLHLPLAATGVIVKGNWCGNGLLCILQFHNYLCLC